MAIMASAAGGGTFTPHPTGQFGAVCVDVYDLGLVEGFEGKLQHKIDIYWFCDEWKDLDDGSRVPLLVRERFTLSLHERSRLRPFLEAWRDKAFSEEELHGFDVEKLIGAPALLQLIQKKDGERTYTNIASIMRLPKGMQAPAKPEGFRRKHEIEAEKAAQQPGPNPTTAGRPWDDDDMPF